MATPNDRALLKAAEDAARALKSAATWCVSKRPVDATDDFVYETYVLLRFLNECLPQYDVQYQPGTGTYAHSFPKKPANKKGRPRFLLKDSQTGAVLWQVCAGTKVQDMNGHKRAPDLSVQVPGAPDLPDGTHLAFIWDAKYSQGGSRLSSDAFSVFARWLELFQLRGKPPPPLSLGNMQDMLGHCLVTNGDHSTELNVECTRVSLMEVASFYPGQTRRVRP